MKAMNAANVKGDEVMKGAVRKILVHSKNLMLVYWEINGEGELSHSHPHEQLGYIVKGSAELTAGGKTVQLGAGSSYIIEPNEHHVFKVKGKGTTIILDIFHPMREDYLPK
jgi:quercetin dioxygenase-like cupin family protein